MSLFARIVIPGSETNPSLKPWLNLGHFHFVGLAYARVYPHDMPKNIAIASAIISPLQRKRTPYNTHIICPLLFLYLSMFALFTMFLRENFPSNFAYASRIKAI